MISSGGWPYLPFLGSMLLDNLGNANLNRRGLNIAYFRQRCVMLSQALPKLYQVSGYAC